MNNDPMNRLMANFSKGNFDVSAEEIFGKKADAEDRERGRLALIGDCVELRGEIEAVQNRPVNRLIENFAAGKGAKE